MPTTTKKIVESLPYYEYVGGCTHSDFWPITVRQTTIVKNSPSHRVKPDVLFKNPTPLPTQWTLEDEFGRQKQEWLTVDRGCSPWKVVVYIAWKYDISSYGIPIDAPTTNWQAAMRAKIKGELLNLGSHLAEYRDTVSSFERYALGAWDAWKCIRGKVNFCKRFNDCDISAAALDASFNLRPLLSDVHRSLEILNDTVNSEVWKKLSVSAQAKKKVKHSATAYHVWEVSERAEIYVQFDAESTGFTASNPAEWAWELTPFSFVVDWGIPIGDYLSSLDAMNGVTDLIGTVTRKERMTGTQKAASAGYIRTKDLTCKYKSHKRSVLLGRGSIPQAEFPSYSPSRSWNSLVNAVSLLLQIKRECGYLGHNRKK